MMIKINIVTTTNDSNVSENNKNYTITICSLDDPNRIIPEYHVWTEDQIPWLHIQDDNPRFRKESR